MVGSAHPTISSRIVSGRGFHLLHAFLGRLRAQPITSWARTFGTVGRKERRSEFGIGKTARWADQALRKESLFALSDEHLHHIVAVAQRRFQRVRQPAGNATLHHQAINDQVEVCGSFASKGNFIPKLIERAIHAYAHEASPTELLQDAAE